MLQEAHKEMYYAWILTMDICQENFNPNLLIAGAQLDVETKRED